VTVSYVIVDGKNLNLVSVFIIFLYLVLFLFFQTKAISPLTKQNLTFI